MRESNFSACGILRSLLRSSLYGKLPQVLLEDQYLLVVDKPSGMVVNRGFGAVETVQDWVDDRVKARSKLEADVLGGRQQDQGFSARSGVVHRLDKETSGVLLIAKTPEVFHGLQRQFKEREIEKTYLALVHGKVYPPRGLIEAPIARNPRNRKRFGVVEGGREAVTEYRVTQLLGDLATSACYSLVEFYPKTGRTHQIRVHAKHIGHPIVSDPLYAGRKTARTDRKWCPRLFLHAAKLTFTHPVGGKRMMVKAPLPGGLKEILRTLKS